MSSDEIEYQRVIWHSRRGMLELDLVLEPFVKKQYPLLDDGQQAAYRALLDCQDQELYDWFLGKSAPATLQLQQIVRVVLEYQAGRDLTELI